MPTGQPGAPTPPGSAATPSLAQPAAAVSGGGPGATYSVQQSPVQVGNYLPAPTVATQQSAPVATPGAGAAPTAPPEPMTFPGVAAAPGQSLPGTPAPIKPSLPVAPGLPGQAAPTVNQGSATTTETAASRPRWSEWQAEFTKLGLPEKLIATIGASSMSDEELADLYVEAEAKLQGATPTSGTNGTAGSTSSEAGWNDSWEQRFAKLGLNAEELALVRQEAVARGSNEQQLGQLYEDLARQMATTGAAGTDAAGGSVEDVLAKHAKAGVPQEILQFYGQQAASPGGLDAALTTLEERVAKLEERGWKAKFEKAGLPPTMLWETAIGTDKKTGQPGGPLPTDGELQQQLTTIQRSEAGMGRNVLEMGVSLIPGVQAAQRVFGARNTITDSDMVTEGKIGMLNNGLAVASGVALGAVLLNKGRGLSTLRQGIAAAKGGYAELAAASVKGLAADSTAAKLAAKSAGGELSFGKALFNRQLRRDVSGLAHVETAAKQFNANGSKLDALSRASVQQLFDGVAGGGIAVAGGRRLNTIPFRAGAAAKLGPMKGQEGDVLQFSGKLGIGDGRSQLAATTKVAGDNVAKDPAIPLSDMQRTGLGDAMAGRVVNELGIGRDGSAARTLRKLDDKGNPASWYTDLPGTDRPTPGVNAGSATSAD